MADTLVFKVKGVEYPMPSSLTFGDAALLKKMGINLGELARAVEDENQSILGDPFVMGGMLLVAMKRAGVKVTPKFLDDLDITDVEVEVPDSDDDEADVPLVETPTPPSSATTPADSGAPDSETSLESILGS